jgi:hypothetical protein
VTRPADKPTMVENAAAIAFGHAVKGRLTIPTLRRLPAMVAYLFGVQRALTLLHADDNSKRIRKLIEWAKSADDADVNPVALEYEDVLAEQWLAEGAGLVLGFRKIAAMDAGDENWEDVTLPADPPAPAPADSPTGPGGLVRLNSVDAFLEGITTTLEAIAGDQPERLVQLARRLKAALPEPVTIGDEYERALLSEIHEQAQWFVRMKAKAEELDRVAGAMVLAHQPTAAEDDEIEKARRRRWAN